MVLKLAAFRPISRPFFQCPVHHSRKLFFRDITTDSDNNLEGLISPDFNFPANENSKTRSFSPQEFSFLRDSLLGTEISPQVAEFDAGKCSTDALAVIDALRKNNDASSDKTQQFLRQFRGKLNEKLVIDVLTNVRSKALGVKFFMWAGRQIGYTHSPVVYDYLLELLDCYKSNGMQEKIFMEMKNDDREVLGKLLNILIRKCCRNGLWNIALEELGRLKDYGYKPSRVAYISLVQVFLEVDRFDSAALVHKEMSDLGFKMDMHTLNCFVRAMCKKGKWREALDLIEKEDFMPNTVMYTNMISGLCEASLFEEAMEILSKMRCNSCVPNDVTYEILLCACLNKGKLGRCKRLVSMMITEGCYPRPKIFNSLVHAYCRSGDYSYAYKLLKKIEDCGYQPGYVVYNILIGAICGKDELPSLDAYELAEKVYDEMLQRGVLLNKVNVSNYTRCLSAFGKFEKALNVIREMMTKGFVPDVSTYSKVIGFLCNASKLDKAFLLFEEMKKNGLNPDIYTYTILIDNFCKFGLIQQARKWFDEMVTRGCSPNVVTYTALIHAYLKTRKIDEANALFELMLLEGCVPNIVTLTVLIDGFCKAGDIGKALQIFMKMTGKTDVPEVDMYFKAEEDDCVMEPNVFTYGALVDGLCKAHKVKEGRDLLDVMFADGCEPNQIVYNALIDGLCKDGKLEDAQEVYAKMLERGYRPTVYTYGSLLDRLFKDKRLDLATKVLSKMLENSCAPNVVIYTEMIDGLSKVGKTDEAYKLLIMMQEKGCQPSVVTYTAMIDGFGKARRLDRCTELFHKMGLEGCAPNHVTYAVLIKHYCNGGLLDEACELLKDMNRTYWPMQIASYRKVIEGYNREFITSLGLLDEINEIDSLPISIGYKLLIDRLQKAGKLDVAVEVVKDISVTLSSMSTLKDMYSSLIESFCCSHKVDKAFELYVDMINKGAIPELSVFVNLIKGLVKVNQWENALQLSDALCSMMEPSLSTVPFKSSNHGVTDGD